MIERYDELYNLINTALTDWREAIDNEPLPQLDEPFYFWSGNMYLSAIEDARQRHQNNYPGDYPQENWGRGHLRFHKQLKDQRKLAPKKVATLGVGVDAVLVQNLLEVYRGVEVFAVEIEPSRLEGAKETLLSARPKEDLARRVHFCPGDAAEVLPTLPKMDLIDTQLLLIHLPKDPPILQGVLGSIADNLAPDGLATVSDLAIREWNVLPAKGYEKDPDVGSLINIARTYLHGNRNIGGVFPGAIELAWGRTKANPWANKEEIAAAVQTHTNGRLRLVGDAAAQMSTGILDTLTIPHKPLLQP